MRVNRFFGALVGATCLSVGTAAADETNEPMFGAVVDVWAGYVMFDEAGDTKGSDVISNTGRFGGLLQADLMLSSIMPGLGVQLDVEGDALTSRAHNNSTDNPHNILQTGLHLTKRNYESGNMFGVFGAAGWVHISNTPDRRDSEEGALFGGEVQLNFDDVSLFGQGGGYWGTGNDKETMNSAYFMKGGAHYFHGDNTMFTGSLLYGRGSNDAAKSRRGGNTNRHDFMFASLNARAQHALPIKQVPVSFFGSYELNFIHQEEASFSPGPEDILTEHVFLAGFSIALNTGSVKNTNQRRIAPAIPTDMLRVSGYSVDIVD